MGSISQIRMPAKILANMLGWFQNDFLGVIRQVRWSYLPPLMVYFAAGVSGFTGIIESFFVKENLGLNPAFLASLGFWAGLPWALKMPLGHLVDLFWQRKSLLVYLGAALMALSLLIMVGLTGYTDWMAGLLPVESWYVISVLLAPLGFVLQDVVADAMTVEAVPTHYKDGTAISQNKLQQMHVTMQILGCIAIVGGGAIVAGAGGWLAKTMSYATMYWISLLIPAISVVGVMMAAGLQKYRRKHFGPNGFRRELAEQLPVNNESMPAVNWHILIGSAIFVVVSIIFGLSDISLRKEIIFLGSLSVVVFLMLQIIQDLNPIKRREIIGLAVIIFVFRAMPTAGAGAGWWQIDALGFDEAFFGTLRQMAAILAILGMLALRGWMARRPLPYLVVFLAVYGTVMSAPFVGMYYGLHEWTQHHLGFGARTIAIIDTMADSPLGQVAMIPMLAWIAKEAPKNRKATYFAVMAAFTNLALSASHLGTQYLNDIFVVERGHYGELGALMITAALLGLVLPIITVLLLKPTCYQIWNGGFKYVQQKIINHCFTVFTRIGSRRLGSICGEEPGTADNSFDRFFQKPCDDRCYTLTRRETNRLYDALGASPQRVCSQGGRK
jgi:MFS family permease